MTNEQAIKIATVVWGWTYDGAFWLENGVNTGLKLDDIESVLFSWNGFGKSLESSGEKPAALLFKVLLIGCFGDSKSDDLITATHLAALEACESAIRK